MKTKNIHPQTHALCPHLSCHVRRLSSLSVQPADIAQPVCKQYFPLPLTSCLKCTAALNTPFDFREHLLHLGSFVWVLESAVISQF